MNLVKAFVVAKVLDLMGDNIIKNRMIAPGGNMGLQRSMMPQIASNRLGEFFSHAKKHGITFQKKEVQTKDLKLVQSEYNKDKVLSLMKIYKKAGAETDHPEPPLVSSDGYVIDGSHRFLAQHNLDPANARMKVMQASVDAKTLLKAAKSFAGVQYRTWSDKRA